MKSTLLLLAITLFMSCSTTKNTKQTMEKAKTTVDSKQMIEDGFLKGTIVTLKAEDGCPYVIEIAGKDGNYFLDPTNLEETYQKDGMKVWFTFQGLRMMNRCGNAAPIAIDKIEERAE